MLEQFNYVFWAMYMKQMLAFFTNAICGQSVLYPVTSQNSCAT
jgi:hypothetical protein